MYEDEIISEVWKTRELYAERHHHNLREIVADLQARQKKPFSRLVDKRQQRAASTSLSESVPPKKS